MSEHPARGEFPAYARRWLEGLVKSPPGRRYYVAFHPEFRTAFLRRKDHAGLAEWKQRRFDRFRGKPAMICDVTSEIVAAVFALWDRFAAIGIKRVGLAFAPLHEPHLVVGDRSEPDFARQLAAGRWHCLLESIAPGDVIPLPRDSFDSVNDGSPSPSWLAEFPRIRTRRQATVIARREVSPRLAVQVVLSHVEAGSGSSFAGWVSLVVPGMGKLPVETGDVRSLAAALVAMADEIDGRPELAT